MRKLLRTESVSASGHREKRRWRFALAARIGRCDRSADGWFELTVAEAARGDDYLFVLADGKAVPDPASNAQAGDVHGPSLIVEPSYLWANAGWRGQTLERGRHQRRSISALSRRRDISAAAEKAEPSCGDRHHGDRDDAGGAIFGDDAAGVMTVCCTTHRTRPTVRRRISGLSSMPPMASASWCCSTSSTITSARRGIISTAMRRDFFRADRDTPWGAAINFGREAVRRYFIENALYWIGEFRLDGLRLDAVEQIHDTSKSPCARPLASEVRAAFADRQVHLVVEDQRNLVSLLERDDGGNPKTYTAEWNDDFHHVTHVIATGETLGHYKPFAEDLWKKLDARAPARFRLSRPGRYAGNFQPASASICRRPPSSISCRTTTRSATAPSASA